VAVCSESIANGWSPASEYNGEYTIDTDQRSNNVNPADTGSK